MALLPLPPSPAYFLASCVKAEAFAQIAGMPGSANPTGATAGQILAEETDAAVQEALSDRIPTGSIVAQIDQGFIGHIVARAARRFMSSRGYDREAGADEEVVGLAKRADAYIASCGPTANSGPGKRITPNYILAGNAPAPPVVDGVRISSHRTPASAVLSLSGNGAPR